MNPETNSKAPKPAAPVIRLGSQESVADWRRFLPASIASAVFHIFLVGLLVWLIPFGPLQSAPLPADDGSVNADADDVHKDPFLTTDIDPAMQEFDTDIQYRVDRRADISVPGMATPNDAVGILNAAKDAPPISLPAPGGLGTKGQGGTIDGPGLGASAGQLGGYGLRGLPLAGSFYGRSGATREAALRDGGGTGESEAAVTRGLLWLQKRQLDDGSWKLDRADNDIGGTALGMLPFLGAGKTHKAPKEKEYPNPYQKTVEKGLRYLLSRQDKSNGKFDTRNNMYGQALASIVLTEAYALSQDPSLRKPAQAAINFIVSAQHDEGGWRYSPGQAGDMSVTGWQVMALKSAQMAGLDVPEVTMRKAVRFLDIDSNASNETYGYTDISRTTPATTAVGLLCRQYLQGWDGRNPRLIRGIDNFRSNPPGYSKNIYYEYHATQVMHHVGGEPWKKWNEAMREHLIRTQDKTGSESGSWSNANDEWAERVGRVMQTSMSILTLEVYYRYLPLFYRD